MIEFSFTVGTSKKAHEILRKMSTRSTGDGKIKPKAPFASMGHTYLFAFILGLTTGNKEIIKGNKETYARFIPTVSGASGGDYDFAELLTQLGEKSDMESRDNALRAIEEYANWGLLEMEEYNLGEEDYQIGKLLNSYLSKDEEKKVSWPPKGLNPGDWKTATWLIEGKLAGAERPGRKGSGDTSQVEKSEVDEWIQAAKDLDPPIKSIICLLDDDQLGLYKCVEEQGGLIEYYRSKGFEVENESVKHPDDGKKLPDDKITAASEAYGKIPDPVVVHCSAAQGRTRDAINDGILPDHFND